MAQKKGQNSQDVPKPKAVVKKPAIKHTPIQNDNKSKVQEIQNLMESYGLDIERIVRDIIQQELQRLGITNSSGLSQQKNNVSFTLPEDEEDYIDDPMDVDLTRIEDAKDLATIEGRIGDSSISVVVDSASNRDIIPKFIADEFGLVVNTNNTQNIRGVPGITKSYGITSTSIALAPGCTIKINPTVIDGYHVREIILGRTTLRWHNYDLHESRKHMAITCNGKNFFIPIVPDKNRHKLVEKKEEEVSPVVTAIKI
jgi:hypothetical protein